MNNERTTLFLMANLGIEMQRLFSYAPEEKEKIVSSSHRAKSIIVQISQKEDIHNGYKELEKLLDIIMDKMHVQNLTITKQQLNTYFQPFIIRNSVIL